jgi:hypothetical protein
VKLDPKLTARCLEMAGETAPKRGKAKRAKPELVQPGNPAPGVWLIPYEACSEANQRVWQGRNRRAGAAWRAVRAAVSLASLVPFEVALNFGEVVRAKFVRLGGRRLDRLVNLPSSLKGVEDAVAYLLGIDDGSPQWAPECAQEPGDGPLGVRVVLEVVK